MTQLSLFDQQQVGNLTREVPMTVGRIVFAPKAPPLPTFAPGSETSRKAAIAKYDKHDSTIQWEFILSFIRERGGYGATREEIQKWFGLSGDSVRPRIKELLAEAKGWTEPRIKRTTGSRPTEAGNQAEVLVAI